jgi:hypothetical protein
LSLTIVSISFALFIFSGVSKSVIFVKFIAASGAVRSGFLGFLMIKS